MLALLRGLLGSALSVTLVVACAGIAFAQNYTFTQLVDGAGFSSLSAPSLNNKGAFAFVGESAETGVRSILLGKGGPLVTVVDTSGDLFFLGSPCFAQ